MKRTIYVWLCFAIAFSEAKAQDLNYFDPPAPHQKSIQLTAGTQGVGAEFNFGLTGRLAMRAGASFIPLTVNNAFPISGITSQSTLAASFSNVHLLADFTPFKGASFLRLVGGAGYFIHAKGDFEMQPTGNYSYGDITMTAAETGKVNMDVDWKGVAPYAGFGLAKAFPRHAFNVNLDLGMYYLTSPITTVVGTGLLDGNESQNAQFQKNMVGYRFLPVVQLNFNFKL